MNTEFTVDYFIQKFEAIPESKWVSSILFDNGRSCANGHCGVRHWKQNDSMRNDHYFKTTKESMALVPIFKHLKCDRNTDHVEYYSDIAATINNGSDKRYQQSTPKQRILAALHDIKKLQQQTHTDITKELAVLPVAETSDTIRKQVLS